MPRITIPNLLQQQVANNSTHAGLRFHVEAEKRNFSREYVAQLKNSAKPNQYNQYSAEWIKVYQESQQFTVAQVKVLGRLNAGLGNASIHEVGFSFHHTFGIPFLPGSTIKGWLADFAKQRIENLAQPVYDALFGTQSMAGVVSFHDALPRNREDINIAPDIVNPHQKYYYRGTHDDAPSDMDTPVVVPFLTVAKGTSFYIPIQSEYADYRRVAVDILKQALEHSAIGAKTNAGYGRMQFVTEL